MQFVSANVSARLLSKQKLYAYSKVKLLLKVIVFRELHLKPRRQTARKLHWNRSWFTRAILKLQLQRDKNCIELRDKIRLCKRA